MASFNFYIPEFLNELKQHVNLSESAWLIIYEDIKNFFDAEEKESFSGFLNRVFINYYQRSQATISLRLEEKETELNNILDSLDFNQKNKQIVNVFIKSYLEQYKFSLLNRREKNKGIGKKFRLNKKSLEILRESIEGSYYYGLHREYLQSIFEEYAAKPSYLREQIFFSNIISEINEAIRNKKKLKVVLLTKTNVAGTKKYKRKFYVYPFQIIQDKTNSFNYLIGFSEEIKEIEEIDENNNKIKKIEILSKTPSCFRISRIEKIDVMQSMGGYISEADQTKLKNIIIERTPMYISSEPIEIKVLFSEKGLESFKRQLYMRPLFYTKSKENKFIYTFKCTEIQALNYFFKFGWDAEILEPVSLRKKFISRYERALKSYNGMNKQEILESEQ